MWFRKAEDAKSLEDLADSEGQDVLDTRFGTAMKQIVKSDLRRDIKIANHERRKQNLSLLNGRQMLWMLKQSLQSNDTPQLISEMKQILQTHMIDTKLRRVN